MSYLTVPALFAYAHGKQPREGPHMCYYCGAKCTDEHKGKVYVKSSFTGRDGVRAPGSDYVCDGCVMCLEEKADITTHDGKVRTGQKVRGYSWVLTKTNAIACTKADMAFLREMCLNPPEPPFCILLNDAGQKQLLYRSPVCYSRGTVTIQFETDTITYRVCYLTDRLRLTKQLVAATGKPALKEQPTEGMAIRLYDHFGDDFEHLFTQWERVWQEPLSRVAAWLCPAKEECLIEYPARTVNSGVSPKTGGTTRPESGSRPDGEEEPERGSHPLFEYFGEAL